MSFEGHSLTGAEVSHPAGIHGASSPRLLLLLLDVIFVFLFLLESGGPGRGGGRGSHSSAGGLGAGPCPGLGACGSAAVPCALPGSRDGDGLRALPGSRACLPGHLASLPGSRRQRWRQSWFLRRFIYISDDGIG